MNPTELANLVGTLPEYDHAIPTEHGFDPSFSSDIAHFESSLEKAGMVHLDSETMEVAKSVLEPFNALNVEAAELAEYAQNAQNNGDNFTPAEIVTMTYKAQEFGFHSQLTSNIANRLADGVQQLFRQQG